MRKIILNLAVSLDGFIEGPNGEFDWCFTDQDYGMTEFLESTDAIVFGRKSYEVLLAYDRNAYPDKKKYVFSRTLKTEAASTFIINDDLQKIILDLKRQSGKDIWLFGGADLIEQFLKAGLIDEFMLSVHPILLGKGKPLFKNLNERVPLTLLKSKSYSSGLVQLFYTGTKESH